MLIKCPECSKEISDKAERCIHCGYPLEKESDKICKINGIKYDFSDVYERIINYKNRGGKADFFDEADIEYKTIWNDIFKMTKLVKSVKLCEKIFAEEKVPKEFNGAEASSRPIPKCPTCSSTNIRNIRFFEDSMYSRKTFVCNNCGYKW